MTEDASNDPGQYQPTNIQEMFAPGNRTIGFPGFFVYPGKDPDVHFPVCGGNYVKPFGNTKDLFEDIARAIKNARKSIDIMTWGMDTDMRLIRKGPPNEYYRTIQYKKRENTWEEFDAGLYPARQADAPPPDPWPTQNPGRGARGDVDSWVLADLLQRKGLKCNIRILCWQPNTFQANFTDPLHFWWRCKLGLVQNVRFVLRSFAGVPPSGPSAGADKPERPELVYKNGQKHRDGENKTLEDKAWNIIAQQPIYSQLFTPHQKAVLIDVESPSRAIGYVMGCNFKEEYWDTREHAAADPFRRPYRPVQDAGVKLCGPILYSLARDFEENWDVMSTNFGVQYEVTPASLVGEAILDGPWRGRTVNHANAIDSFDKYAYRRLATLPRYEFKWKGYWGSQLAPQAVELCVFLHTLCDAVEVIANSNFDTWTALPASTPFLKPFTEWIPGAPLFGFKGLPEGEAKLNCAAQLVRTVCEEGRKKDFSIREALKTCIAKTQNQQVIYVENQYFRDPYFAQSIVELYKLNIRPKVVVVTNPLSDIMKNPSGGSRLAEEPTYIAVNILKESDVDCCVCWLRVKEPDPDFPRYVEHRAAPLFTFFLDNAFGPTFAKLIVTKKWALPDRYQGVVKGTEYEFAFPPGEEMTTLERLRLLYMRLWAVVPELEKYDRGVRTAETEAAAGFFKRIPSLIPSQIRERTGHMYDETIAPGFDGTKAGPVNLEALYAELDAFLDIEGSLQRLNEEVGAAVSEATRRYKEYVWRVVKNLWREYQDRRVRPPEGPAPKHDTTLYDAMMERLGRYQASWGKRELLDARFYVHSKVLIIDGNYAMVGTNNMNERSVWSDSELAIQFTAMDTHSRPMELWKELWGGILQENPEDWSKEEPYVHFKASLRVNDGHYGPNGKFSTPLPHNILTYTPATRKTGLSSVS